MEEPPRFILPSSAAPGAPMEGEAEKTPEGVQYYRVYAGLLAVCDAIAVVFGCFQIGAAIAHPRGGAHGGGELLSGMFWAVICGAHLLATLISLFGGKKPWIHTLGMAVIVVSMFTCCCVPFGIPMLIAYSKPEVKRFYWA